MQIQINYGDIDGSDALGEAVEKAVHKELANVADRITRVEVHLRDDKQKRRGPDDKRCLMEARIASERPLAVEGRGPATSTDRSARLPASSDGRSRRSSDRLKP